MTRLCMLSMRSPLLTDRRILDGYGLLDDLYVYGGINHKNVRYSKGNLERFMLRDQSRPAPAMIYVANWVYAKYR